MSTFRIYVGIFLMLAGIAIVGATTVGIALFLAAMLESFEQRELQEVVACMIVLIVLVHIFHLGVQAAWASGGFFRS